MMNYKKAKATKHGEKKKKLQKKKGPDLCPV